MTAFHSVLLKIIQIPALVRVRLGLFRDWLSNLRSSQVLEPFHLRSFVHLLMCGRPQAGALSVRDLYDAIVAHEQLHPTAASLK